MTITDPWFEPTREPRPTRRVVALLDRLDAWLFGTWEQRQYHWHLAKIRRQIGAMASRYDRGGWLAPGVTVARNKTGKAERLVRPQWGGGNGGANTPSGAWFTPGNGGGTVTGGTATGGEFARVTREAIEPALNRAMARALDGT